MGRHKKNKRKKRQTSQNIPVEEKEKKALEIDPLNRYAHFGLLALYEKLGNKSLVNRKLDEILFLSS